MARTYVKKYPERTRRNRIVHDYQAVKQRLDHHTPGVCPGCGGPVSSKDPKALHCDTRCRMVVHRARYGTVLSAADWREIKQYEREALEKPMMDSTRNSKLGKWHDA